MVPTVLVLLVVALGVAGLLIDDPDEQPPAPLAAGLYRTGDRCLAFRPGEGWTATKEYPKAGSGFSVDENLVGADPAAGEPGVFVRASCGSLDKLGRSGPISIPGADLTEDRKVDLADGRGRVLVYVYDAGEDLPAMESVAVSLDVHGVRCGLHAYGSRSAVDAVRDQVDRAIASMRCLGL